MLFYQRAELELWGGMGKSSPVLSVGGFFLVPYNGFPELKRFPQRGFYNNNICFLLELHLAT